MPLPPGTYPIGGPVVPTGEKPAASEALYAAAATWPGPDGQEVIERSGSPGSYTYAWVSKGAEQRVLVGVPASDDTVDKLIVEDSQLYTTVPKVVHEATPRQAAFQSISFDIGYFSDESALDATFYAAGRFYYNFAKHKPRVVAYISGDRGPKHWVDGDAATLVPNITADVGHFASDEEATPSVSAVGNVYYNETLRTYRRARTFTAGTGPVTREERRRLANEDDLAVTHNTREDLTGDMHFRVAFPTHFSGIDAADLLPRIRLETNNAQHLNIDTWIELHANGVALQTAREHWNPVHSARNVNRDLTQAQADAIAATLDETSTRVQVEVRFFAALAGGDSFDSIWLNIPIRIPTEAQFERTTEGTPLTASDRFLVRQTDVHAEFAVSNFVDMTTTTPRFPDVDQKVMIAGTEYFYFPSAEVSSIGLPDDMGDIQTVAVDRNAPREISIIEDYRTGHKISCILVSADRAVVLVDDDLASITMVSGTHGRPGNPAARNAADSRTPALFEANLGELNGVAIGGYQLPTQVFRDTDGDVEIHGLGTDGYPTILSLSPATSFVGGRQIPRVSIRLARYAIEDTTVGEETHTATLQKVSQWVADHVDSSAPLVLGSRALGVAATADGGDSAKAAREDHIHDLALNASHLYFATGDELNLSAGILHAINNGHAGTAQSTADLEARTADLNITGRAEWREVPQLTSADSPPEATITDNTGPAIHYRRDGNTDRDSETLVLASYNAAHWRNTVDAGAPSNDPLRAGGFSGTLWIRLPGDANPNHYRLVVEHAGVVTRHSVAGIAERWNGLDADATNILAGQHLYRVTRVSTQAQVPLAPEDLRTAGIPLQIPGNGSVALEVRTSAGAQHTRYDGVLGAGPLEQAQEVAAAEAATTAQIIDLPNDGTNAVTWNVDNGEVASILLSGSMRLSMSGGRAGDVARLMIRNTGLALAPGGAPWAVALVGIQNPRGISTEVIGAGVNVMRFEKLAVHFRNLSTNADISEWTFMGFEGRARFETAVGASNTDGNVPAGTTELAVLCRVSGTSTNRHVEQRILLSNVPAADRDFFARGNTGEGIGVRMRFDSTPNKLIYSAVNAASGAAIVSITAIGYA